MNPGESSRDPRRSAPEQPNGRAADGEAIGPNDGAPDSDPVLSLQQELSALTADAAASADEATAALARDAVAAAGDASTEELPQLSSEEVLAILSGMESDSTPPRAHDGDDAGRSHSADEFSDARLGNALAGAGLDTPPSGTDQMVRDAEPNEAPVADANAASLAAAAPPSVPRPTDRAQPVPLATKVRVARRERAAAAPATSPVGAPAPAPAQSTNDDRGDVGAAVAESDHDHVETDPPAPDTALSSLPAATALPSGPPIDLPDVEREVVAHPEPGPSSRGARLVAAGMITENLLAEQLHAAGARQSAVGEALMRAGYISRARLYDTLAQDYGTPLAVLDDFVPEASLEDVVPLDVADEYGVVPVLALHDVLCFMLHEVDDLESTALADLRRMTGKRIAIVHAEAAQFAVVRRRVYGLPDPPPEPERPVDESPPVDPADVSADLHSETRPLLEGLNIEKLSVPAKIDLKHITEAELEVSQQIEAFKPNRHSDTDAPDGE